jgi:hypothetical protein
MDAQRGSDERDLTRQAAPPRRQQRQRHDPGTDGERGEQTAGWIERDSSGLCPVQRDVPLVHRWFSVAPDRRGSRRLTLNYYIAIFSHERDGSAMGRRKIVCS